MAQSNVQSAFEIEITVEERAWFRMVEERVEARCEAEADDGIELAVEILHDVLNLEKDSLLCFDGGSWGWELTPIGEGRLHFSMEEGGDIELMAEVLKRFLAKFRPQGHVVLEWACWCSKPRADQFFGGSCVVTATHIDHLDRGAWVTEILALRGVSA